jgi:glutamate synthase (ferredoxin)
MSSNYSSGLEISPGSPNDYGSRSVSKPTFPQRTRRNCRLLRILQRPARTLGRPRLLVFSDGKQVGAALDRNGLRPARYCITKDNLVIVASEAGVVEVPEADIVEKGRLGPGQMLAVDFETHEVLKNWEIKERVAGQAPYGDWLKQYRVELNSQPFEENQQLESQPWMTLQTAFGYGLEDMEMVISDMASLGKEPTFCMGDDIPLAVLSDKPHLLYDYFKQRFAQVTNPPLIPCGNEW